MYSDELKQLTKEMLHVDPSNRPELSTMMASPVLINQLLDLDMDIGRYSNINPGVRIGLIFLIFGVLGLFFVISGYWDRFRDFGVLGLFSWYWGIGTVFWLILIRHFHHKSWFLPFQAPLKICRIWHQEQNFALVFNFLQILSTFLKHHKVEALQPWVSIESEEEILKNFCQWNKWCRERPSLRESQRFSTAHEISFLG